MGVQEVLASCYRGCGAFVSNLGVDSGVSEHNHMPKLCLSFTGRFEGCSSGKACLLSCLEARLGRAAADAVHVGLLLGSPWGGLNGKTIPNSLAFWHHDVEPHIMLTSMRKHLQLWYGMFAPCARVVCLICFDMSENAHPDIPACPHAEYNHAVNHKEQRPHCFHTRFQSHTQKLNGKR